MELDILAMFYDCRQKVGSENQEQVIACFCDKFIEELKKVEGEELALHFESAMYEQGRKETLLTFHF